MLASGWLKESNKQSIGKGLCLVGTSHVLTPSSFLWPGLRGPRKVASWFMFLSLGDWSQSCCCPSGKRVPQLHCLKQEPPAPVAVMSPEGCCECKTHAVF